VLAVGGVQEKLLAAQRSGIKTVVVPAACKADIEHNVRSFPNLFAFDQPRHQVSASVKEGMEILYAEDVRQSLKTAFKDDLEFVKRIEALPISERIER
jgi:Lon-like ATP-dependent protease